VLYVGNGKNDSSELSAADVSVCVNGLSSEIAFQSGDVIVMDDSPGPLADAIDSARIAKRTIRSCLLMTLTAKAALLFLAVVGWEYQLWFAMLVEVLAGTIGILRASRAGKSDL
jgi:Cd2+/Zn2+-exporting ATPase